MGAFDEFVDASGQPHPAVTAVVRRLEQLRGALLQMNGGVFQGLGVHEVLTQVDDTAALCEAIHADYLDPPAEDLLRGVRTMRVVPPEPSARQMA